MVKASSDAQREDGQDRENEAERERLARLHAARGNRTLRGAAHQRVDVGVVPHVQRAGRACAHGDGEQSRETDDGMGGLGRDHHAGERGQHDKRHHPRLEQREVIRRARVGDARGGQPVLMVADEAHAPSIRAARRS